MGFSLAQGGNMKKILILLSMLIPFTACMSGKQRFKLQRDLIRAQAAQARTYTPLVMQGKTTISAENGITIVVPQEQLNFTPIPNDFETIADLTKFGLGVGGAIIGVKELNKTRTTKVVNQAPAAATP